MNRVERLLVHLKNGRWHRKLPQETGIGVWQACVRLKLVKEALVHNRKHGKYYAKIKITARGKKILENSAFPNREKLSKAIHSSPASG